MSVVKRSKPEARKKLTRVRQLEVLVLELVHLVELVGGEDLMQLEQYERVTEQRKLIAHERDEDGAKHDGSSK